MMGSVDRSANKGGLHENPSRLTTDGTGRSRAAIDPVRHRVRCLKRQAVGHDPPAHRNSKLGRRAAREG
jgi:hypothetical protein